jgi:hypothetical protein
LRRPGWRSLSASAPGWHTIQMAILSFIGICGVLRTAGSSPVPPRGGVAGRGGDRCRARGGVPGGFHGRAGRLPQLPLPVRPAPRRAARPPPGTADQTWCGPLVQGPPAPSASVLPTASSPCPPRPSPRSARWRGAREPGGEPPRVSGSGWTQPRR